MGSTLKVKNLLLGSKFFPVREDNILKGLYLPGELIGSHKSWFPAVKMLEKNMEGIKAPHNSPAKNITAIDFVSS